MKNRVWIIEIKFDGSERWVPTVGAALSLSDGRRVLKEWKERLPDDDLRLFKYEGETT